MTELVRFVRRATSRPALTALLLAIAPPVTAEMIVLKDGTFIEGRIVVRTSRSVRIETRFGSRSVSRSRIDRIIESVDELDLEAVSDFDGLALGPRAVLNAQADYDLGKYHRALDRLETLRDGGDDPALRIHSDWLVIELNERLGNWDKVDQLLRAKLQGALPPERVRAKAHLDIFEANAAYDLRYVGDKHARNFLSDPDLRNRAREPQSLRDHDVMRAALEEYCEQLLVEDKMSVKAFATGLDFDKTYLSVRNAGGQGNIFTYLPYLDNLFGAEAALFKAQAILGDYGRGFELDLVRSELTHLMGVAERLFKEAVEVSPETFRPPFDRRSGRLTGAGRAAWILRCDEFLKRAKPVSRLYAYMRRKVELHPHALRDLRGLLTDRDERFNEMVKSVKRAKGRTHV